MSNPAGNEAITINAPNGLLTRPTNSPRINTATNATKPRHSEPRNISAGLSMCAASDGGRGGGVGSMVLLLSGGVRGFAVQMWFAGKLSGIALASFCPMPVDGRKYP